ncbi:hypothetical protein NEF87_003101 [Candidatus Lokiarchaeum ossiferum]|uniref:50S ribosomal protein L15 n=1 Tax=Candidatus Lokiarchaeum ossiferum TaxID=2951803 RepID=A0ABY6HW56_9ARCH|nr:hypothetical protein NEF87_003101 [Candidatus Lokiarchaeum sp. B-35]
MKVGLKYTPNIKNILREKHVKPRRGRKGNGKGLFH